MRILSQLSPDLDLAPGLRAELRSLEEEPDSARAERDLTQLARRLENQGETETAASLYQLLLGGSRGGEARQRLQVMDGRISGSERVEYLTRRFADHLLDPSMLVGMGAAGFAFRATRLFLLSRIAGMAAPPPAALGSFWASALALNAEIPAFVYASRWTQEAMGQSVDWSDESVGRDYASTAILLASLRLSGLASTALLRRTLPPVGLQALPWQSQVRVGMYQQLTMFGGLLSARTIEAELGLRPRESAEAMITEGLATLIQFNVAGRLAHLAFGPRWAAYERDWEARGLRLQTGPSLAASAEPLHPWRRHARQILLSPLWMVMGAVGDGSGFGGAPRGPRPPAPSRLADLLQRVQQEDASVFRPALQEAGEQFPSFGVEGQLQIVRSLLRAKNTYDGGRREAIALALGRVHPHLNGPVWAALRPLVETVVRSSQRAQEFHRLRALGFGPDSVAPLSPERQAQVAPRVLDYLDDRASAPEAHETARHFLDHLFDQPESLRRDAAIEIVRRGLGTSALPSLYHGLSMESLTPIAEAWSYELQQGSPARRIEAVSRLHELVGLMEIGPVRREAIRELVDRLEDPNLDLRLTARNVLWRLDTETRTVEGRRELTQAWNGLLRRWGEAMIENRLSPELRVEVEALPIAMRALLIEELMTRNPGSDTAREFLEASFHNTAFTDFVLGLRSTSDSRGHRLGSVIPPPPSPSRLSRLPLGEVGEIDALFAFRSAEVLHAPSDRVREIYFQAGDLLRSLPSLRLRSIAETLTIRSGEELRGRETETAAILALTLPSLPPTEAEGARGRLIELALSPGPASQAALRGLHQAFLHLPEAGQRELAFEFLDRTRAASPDCRERAIGVLRQMRPYLANTEVSLFEQALELAERGTRRREEFQDLAQMGFGSQRLPPLGAEELARVAPRALEYLSAGSNGIERGTALYFLEQVVHGSYRFRRQVSQEIGAQRLGMEALPLINLTLRPWDAPNVVSSFSHPIQGPGGRVQDRTASLYLMERMLPNLEPESRVRAIRQMTERITDEDSQVAHAALDILNRLEAGFENEAGRRAWGESWARTLGGWERLYSESEPAEPLRDRLFHLPPGIRATLAAGLRRRNAPEGLPPWSREFLRREDLAVGRR